jgi:hypothetical protein
MKRFSGREDGVGVAYLMTVSENSQAGLVEQRRVVADTCALPSISATKVSPLAGCVRAFWAFFREIDCRRLLPGRAVQPPAGKVETRRSFGSAIPHLRDAPPLSDYRRQLRGDLKSTASSATARSSSTPRKARLAAQDDAVSQNLQMIGASVRR